MARMGGVRNYWRVFPLLARNLKLVLTTPRTLRQAWTNAILWALASLAAVIGFGLGVVSAGPWWLNLPTLFLDATMFQWAIHGLLYLYRRRDAEAEFERLVRDLR
jgi:hypothetical protein